jgi:hypothetical protein
MTSFEDLLNKSFIINLAAEMHSSKGGRTIIVSGLLRFGISLMASMLQQMGIFIGTEIDNSVYEDEEIARALASSNTAALTRIT